MAATVLQITDVHMRADGGELYGVDPAQRLEAVLAACARELERVDLVLLTGDQSDDGGEESTRMVADRFAGLGAPVVAVPGNHDDPAVVRAVFGAPGPVEIGGWRVLCLDTTIPGEIRGSVDVRAAERLIDSAGEQPTLLALHHPPVSPSVHEWFVLEHAPALLASLAERPHVRAVLSGHVHQAFAWRCGPLRLLGGPSTLASLGFAGPEPATAGAGGPTGARALLLGADGSLAEQVIVG